MYNLSKEKIQVSLKKSDAYSKYLKISLFALGITLGLLIILNIIAFILYGDTRINVVIHGVEILTHSVTWVGICSNVLGIIIFILLAILLVFGYRFFKALEKENNFEITNKSE